MSGGSRVSIPNSVRKTIQDIKEITGKHSDEDIYAMLRECSMDPNETTQRLLYLDTFHEVKSKRERRKENLNSRASEDSGQTPGVQGRGARGGRGNYSSNYFFYDASGGRNAAAHRENGVNYSTARGSLPVSQKTENKVMSHVARSSTITVNGPTSVSNGSSSQGRAPQVPVIGAINFPRDSSAVDANKLGTARPLPTVDVKQDPSSAPVPTSTFVSGIGAEQGTSSLSSNHLPTSMTPASVSGVYSSASDPVLVPSLNSWVPSALGTIRREVGSQRVTAESSATVLAEGNNTQSNKHVPQNVDDFELSSFMSRKATTGTVSSMHRKMPSESKGVDKSQLSSSNCDIQSPPQLMGPSKVVASEVATITVEANSRSLPELNVSALEEATSKLHISNAQHVIFPNHFQVPEAFKNGLTFGSFDGSFGLNSKLINGTSGDKTSAPEFDSFQGYNETAGEPSLSNQSVSSADQEVDYPDHPQSPPSMPENILPSDGNLTSGAVPKFDQSKQEILLPSGGPQFPAVQTAPNYSFGFVPPILGNQIVQFEGSEPQACDVSCPPNFASGSSLVLSTSGPTPPATQPTGVGHGSLAVSPQPVPVFRQPYPPNYLPYSPYYPFFMPHVQQFLSHGGFPQQPSTGNVYLPPAAAVTGVKFPLPQYKPGNPTHIGIPSGYGSYGSSAVAYSPSLAVTSGSSTGNEDLATSHLKENNMYTTGQQTEGSTVWIPASGRDISGRPANSFYNLPLQGQHVTFSPAQAGHGPFAGIYHPAQTMAPPSTVHPLLQQSQQGISGSVETVGPPPPSGSYQQPQGAQINWNGSY